MGISRDCFRKFQQRVRHRRDVIIPSARAESTGELAMMRFGTPPRAHAQSAAAQVPLARVVATANVLPEPPTSPFAGGAVTYYRIRVSPRGTCLDADLDAPVRAVWTVSHRYSDFRSLHIRLRRADRLLARLLPSLPPKLLRHADESIAHRQLELDSYLRVSCAAPALSRRRRRFASARLCAPRAPNS